MGGRGMYEIILAFFLIVVLVFAIIFFIFMNASSSVLYGKIKQQTTGPKDAAMLKDTLFTCHALDYLEASILDAQAAGTYSCPAQDMLGGFRVTQLPLNGCQQQEWSFSHDDQAGIIPFIIAVEHPSGLRCLARLDVFIGGGA